MKARRKRAAVSSAAARRTMLDTIERSREDAIRTTECLKAPKAHHSSRLVDAFTVASSRAVRAGATLDEVVHAVYAFAVASARTLDVDRKDAIKMLDRYWMLDEIHDDADEARRTGRLH